jgi:hypothetical protein
MIRGATLAFLLCLIWADSCLLKAQGATPKPMPTSLCAISEAPRRFEGKLVSVHAQYVWGGVHRPALVDNSCGDAGVYPELTDKTIGGGKLEDALNTGYVGTADKTIEATWIGRYFGQSKRNRINKVVIVEITDLTVEPK